MSLNHLPHPSNTIDHGKGNDDDHNIVRPNISTTTYASVLLQGANNQQTNQNNSLNKQQLQSQQQTPEDKDPFAAIRKFGQRSNGLYNYFQ